MVSPVPTTPQWGIIPQAVDRTIRPTHNAYAWLMIGALGFVFYCLSLTCGRLLHQDGTHVQVASGVLAALACFCWVYLGSWWARQYPAKPSAGLLSPPIMGRMIAAFILNACYVAVCYAPAFVAYGLLAARIRAGAGAVRFDAATGQVTTAHVAPGLEITAQVLLLVGCVAALLSMYTPFFVTVNGLSPWQSLTASVYQATRRWKVTGLVFVVVLVVGVLAAVTPNGTHVDWALGVILGVAGGVLVQIGYLVHCTYQGFMRPAGEAGAA